MPTLYASPAEPANLSPARLMTDGIFLTVSAAKITLGLGLVLQDPFPVVSRGTLVRTPQGSGVCSAQLA
ncbi:hypothetical protein NDU88_004905 [Pleurodeles waltl]|uniref:Uncharacterized protein n=1 Tax=Pleurodeles waltl TaxID=8319 RepID=A0AAV7TAZ7_PLEWA|nr:hypothetical protein NDU88_004905 [Pleurodeles waltl]